MVHLPLGDTGENTLDIQFLPHTKGKIRSWKRKCNEACTEAEQHLEQRCRKGRTRKWSSLGVSPREGNGISKEASAQLPSFLHKLPVSEIKAQTMSHLENGSGHTWHTYLVSAQDTEDKLCLERYATLMNAVRPCVFAWPDRSSHDNKASGSVYAAANRHM